MTYGSDGLEMHSPDDDFSAIVGWRNQLRFTTPFIDAPTESNGIEGDERQDFRLNRSRLKVEGHLFSPRITYKLQADFVEERVRDLNVTWTVRDWLRLRGGWWKVEYLLERMQSSGAQQLVDRSILDQWFTLGRQRGVEVFGRVGGTSSWGGTYFLGTFGNVDAGRNGKAMPVWLARYQWAHAGRAVQLEQGDPDASGELLLSIGTSVVRTEGSHAFYSGAGLGQTLPIPGFPEIPVADDPGRFRTHQYAGDAMLKWRGVSLQGELHRKDIRVTGTGAEGTLYGGYVMGGVLASALWSRAPEHLEFSARVAVIDPSAQLRLDRQHERVIGANWYVDGHRKKVSVDVSRLHYFVPAGILRSEVRTRVQWEFTF